MPNFVCLSQCVRDKMQMSQFPNKPRIYIIRLRLDQACLPLLRKFSFSKLQDFISTDEN